MTIRWCLQSGPNESHLWDYEWFDRKKDAQDAANKLPTGSSGEPRPYRIWRHEYKSLPGGWQKDITRHVVVDRVVRNAI